MSNQIQAAVEKSTSLSFLGHFSSAVSCFDKLPDSLAVAITKSTVFCEQNDYLSAVTVLDDVAPPSDPMDFGDLGYVLARMQAEANRWRLSMQNDVASAAEFMESVLQGLRGVAWGKGEEGAAGGNVLDVDGRSEGMDESVAAR